MRIQIDNKLVSGVGTLICCLYNDIPCIVLGREKNKSDYLENEQYEEFGGAISDDKESLEKNATYELKEETANMINIENLEVFNKKIKINNKTIDKYLDLEIPYRNKVYFRCYFLRIDQISEKIFKNNLKLLKNHKNTPKSYLEIDKLVFIPISNFEINNNLNYELSDGYYGDKELFLNIKDIKNKNIRISQRTSNILLNNIEKNKINGLKICKYLCKYKNQNTKMKKIKINDINSFLNKTISLKL